MTKTIGLAISAFIGVIVLALGFGLLFSYPMMWAINWLFTPAALTSVFGVAKLGLLQTFVLTTLLSFIFKGVSSTSSK